MRLILGALLIAVAAFCVAFAYGALQNIWADYRDGTVLGYLIIGGVFLAIAALAGLGAFLLLRAR
jgi:hypothetical protein